MRAILERVAIGVLLALAVFYAGDWIVYRYHVAHGDAFDSIKVNQFMAVPLKNGKEELDYVNSLKMECVRAIFPWAGEQPCWWVRRHAEKRVAL